MTAVARLISRRTAEVLEFRCGHEYAVFTVDEQPARHYYALGIESSYGGFSNAWSHPGPDFRAFLAELDCGYVLSKMVHADQEYDGDGTTRAIREEIVRMRRSGKCDASTARAAWPSATLDSEVEFWEWARENGLFEEEQWYFIATMPGPRARDFARLYEHFWPALAAALCPGAENPSPPAEETAASGQRGAAGPG